MKEGRKDERKDERKDKRKDKRKDERKDGWMGITGKERERGKKSEFVQYSTFVLATYIPAVKSLCLACCALYTCRISLPPNSTSLRT